MTSLAALHADQRFAAPQISRARRPALLGSLLIHAALIVLLLYRIAPNDRANSIKFFPVELVTLTDRTTTPAPARPKVPRQQNASVRPLIRKSPTPSIPLTAPQPTPAAPEKGVEPVPLPPKDALQSRLEAFAKLSLPGNDSILAAGNGIAQGPSGYDVKDYIRAQVEHHWSLDLDAIEDRKITVAIHVVLTPDGVVRKAEIVNNQRADPEYRWLAISARNAAMLASPVTLPAGVPASDLDLVLNLSPTDALK
jgi:hypothetical protein